jgi:hypothetical protein
MERKRVHAIVVILVCTVFTLNCSFFMKPVPSGYEPSQPPDCTDSYIVPASDLLSAASNLVLGLLISSITDFDSPQAYIYLGGGAVYGIASIYGFIRASQCRTATDKHEESYRRMRRLLSSVKLPDRSALPPAPKADPWDAKRAIRILKHHKLAISECMHRQAAADPSVKGKLTATFTVAPDGQVTSVDIIAPEFANTLIAECLNNLIRGIQFPRFEGEPQKVPFFFEVR